MLVQRRYIAGRSHLTPLRWQLYGISYLYCTRELRLPQKHRRDSRLTKKGEADIVGTGLAPISANVREAPRTKGSPPNGRALCRSWSIGPQGHSFARSLQFRVPICPHPFSYVRAYGAGPCLKDGGTRTENGP